MTVVDFVSVMAYRSTQIHRCRFHNSFILLVGAARFELTTPAPKALIQFAV